MAKVDTQSPLLAGIDKAIQEIEQQLQQQQEAEQQAPDGALRGGAGSVSPPAPQPINAQQSIEDLSLFLSRLRQIRDWLQQDSRLLPVVDEFIGQKVSASTKQSNRLNLALAVITTIVGAILGWLVSAFGSPTTLLNALPH
ncbi:MAG TPA: hypothetical protein VF120_09310 [Ktedonobacterales bacterium]